MVTVGIDSITPDGVCGEYSQYYCPQVMDEVCGNDGITYNSLCEAECR